MLKIMTLVGTRPELIKMSRVIAEFDQHVEHILVHSGQNYDYELNQIFFDELDIRKPDVFLNISKDSAVQAIADVIVKADEVFENYKPDALLIYGDTNTCLAIIAAKRRKIPIFHMEAGNRCFDERVPEELNRKVVDHLSDINMVLTEHARRYLINEGIKHETIIKTGSHLNEVLDFYKDKINNSAIVESLKLKNKEYFVVSAHREENVDNCENLNDLIESIELLADKYNYPVYFSTHPRTRKRIESYIQRPIHPLIHFINPLGFFDYVNLQKNAFCVLSDSGTITEEASILGFPAITIRNAHERPEGMDVGTLIMSGLKKERVLDAVHIVTSQHNNCEQRVVPPVDDYQSLSVSKQVLRIVVSYIDYINQNVWRNK
ncbi:non-hydrolyzing UDP-N-acetylglucosamine 2-epimerase [Legionella sp. km772]|uniref:non-hydrolyzing UDP-N-acetylglucosamine 2-epimerase n=1 Tax=Legionella sp. km772 TaxID=2498111 RepID=UPI000F8F6A99|nr:UDP-N-acetylglucosamine 2-epimerase (non-hydrolyzing) [Legionella sp. km772]RUR12750.1 UDP-N-acetylglucosamine 2-epimerase (non-hydrolyzing) [Legionella sp. km772]